MTAELAHITALVVLLHRMQEVGFQVQDVVVMAVTHLVFPTAATPSQCILKAPGLVDDLAVIVRIQHRRQTSEQVYTTIHQ